MREMVKLKLFVSFKLGSKAGSELSFHPHIPFPQTALRKARPKYGKSLWIKAKLAKG